MAGGCKSARKHTHWVVRAQEGPPLLPHHSKAHSRLWSARGRRSRPGTAPPALTCLGACGKHSKTRGVHICSESIVDVTVARQGAPKL